MPTTIFYIHGRSDRPLRMTALSNDPVREAANAIRVGFSTGDRDDGCEVTLFNLPLETAHALLCLARMTPEQHADAVFVLQDIIDKGKADA